MGKRDALASGFKVPAAPKRTAVDDATAKRFVEAKPAAAGGSKLRRDERGERLSVYLPPELASALRVYCARDRRSVSDAVSEAVAQLLERHSATGT